MLAAHVVGGRQEVPDGRTADDEATVADAHPEGQVGRAPRHHLDVEAAVGTVVHVVGEPRDRKSVVQGKSVSVSVDLGGRRIIKKNNDRTAKRLNSTRTK